VKTLRPHQINDLRILADRTAITAGQEDDAETLHELLDAYEEWAASEVRIQELEEQVAYLEGLKETAKEDREALEKIHAIAKEAVS
jgi:hypothetical protein